MTYTHAHGRTLLEDGSTRRNTQHSQDADSHATGGIRTRNPRKRAAAEPHLRPCGQ